MDNKTIFVRTSAGEEQVQSRTSFLSGEIKRALSMVDGSATFGEISKRSAPSMRANLSEMFEELIKTKLIRNKKFVGKIPNPTMPSRMVVPVKMAIPHKKSVVEKNTSDLDFVSSNKKSSQDVLADESNAEQRRVEADTKSKRKIEAEKLKAQQEAATILRLAEEKARLRLEVAAREQKEAETARVKADQEARRVRNELELTKLKAEQEAKRRLEAAERERAAEAARIKADQEAKRIRNELELAKLKAEQEARRHLEAAERERKAAEAARVKAEQEAKRVRDELEVAKRKEENEARLRLEAVENERKAVEAARLKAEQEAAQQRGELELAKHKEELVAEARLEVQAQVDARKKVAEDAEKEREAAALILKQALEAEQAREQVETHTPEVSEAPEREPQTFTFDEFQVNEPQQPAETEETPASLQNVTAKEISPTAAKRDEFVFDSFNVDERVRQTKPEKEQLPGEAVKMSLDVDEPVEYAVPPPVTSETGEHRPGQAKISKEQPYQNVPEQDDDDDIGKEMEIAHAKIWAEAEQRALETAKANADRVAHHVARPSEIGHAEKRVRIVRAPRTPFAWGKLAKGLIYLLMLLLGALFVTPYFLPMRDYMPEVQQLLSKKLHQPVHLGYLSGRFLPTPRLDLGEIYIGDAKQFQAATAQINFDIMGVFSDSKPIDSVNFKNVKVRGMALTDSAAWLQQLAGDKHYPVSRITISQGTLDANAFKLAGIQAALSFSPAGKLTQAKLSANAGKYTVDIDMAPKNILQATITVRDSALPLLPNWTFDKLEAKGEISNKELLIREYDAKIMGGSVQGKARINWSKGWRADGVLSVKQIVMKKMNKLLDGNMDGSAHFKMNAKELASLTDSVKLKGSFMASNGMISGLNIVETARTHSRGNLPGGRTHYDRFSGDVAYDQGVYHFSRVSIDAGVLKADASFDINKQQLSGKIKVNLSMHDGITAVLQLGGMIDNPTLLYVP